VQLLSRTPSATSSGDVYFSHHRRPSATRAAGPLPTTVDRIEAAIKAGTVE